MGVYKVELMIINHDGDMSAKDIKDELENTEFANHCMYPQVTSIVSRELGEWDDDHPLNSSVTAKAYFHGIFLETSEA